MGWPDNLAECSRCHAPSGSRLYAARGLCRACYTREARTADVTCWTIPADVLASAKLDPKERAMQAKERQANPTRKLVRLVGATYTAEVCAVDVAVVCEWFEAGTPSAVCETVEAELQRVRRERARRAALGYGGKCDDAD